MSDLTVGFVAGTMAGAPAAAIVLHVVRRKFRTLWRRHKARVARMNQREIARILGFKDAPPRSIREIREGREPATAPRTYTSRLRPPMKRVVRVRTTRISRARNRVKDWLNTPAAPQVRQPVTTFHKHALGRLR